MTSGWHDSALLHPMPSAMTAPHLVSLQTLCHSPSLLPTFGPQAKEAVRAREARVHEVTKELEAQNLTCKTLNELYDKAQDAAGLAGKRVAEAAELAEREKMKRQKLSEDNQVRGLGEGGFW